MKYLPDLGLRLYADNQLDEFVLVGCEVKSVISDQPGHCLISFAIERDGERFIGSMLTEGDDKETARKIAAWGRKVHIVAKISLSDRYTTDDGQDVIPLIGWYVRHVGELPRPAARAKG